MKTNFELWFTVIFVVFFILTAISWITFAQLSMRPIERKMKSDGVPSDFHWDGTGARIFSYAFAIVFPEMIALRVRRLMDVKVIRSYANKSDWWRGLVFLSVTYSWIALVFLGAILGYAE